MKQLLILIIMIIGPGKVMGADYLSLIHEKTNELVLSTTAKNQKIKLEKTKFQDGFTVNIDKKTTSTTLFNKRSQTIYRMSYMTQGKSKSGFTFFLQAPEASYRQTLKTQKKIHYKIYESANDIFIYQVLFNQQEQMMLKEWGYCLKPNHSMGSRYYWKIAPVNTEEKMILAKTDKGTVVIYRQEKDGLAYPMGTITAPLFWTKDNQLRQASVDVNQDMLVIDIHAEAHEYPILLDPQYYWGS